MSAKRKKTHHKTRTPKTPLRKTLHLIRLTSFTIGFLILLFLFHLLILGVPDQLTQRITAKIRENGIPLHIDTIRLSPQQGWTLHNVRLYSSSPDDIQPLFHTENLYISIRPTNWRAPTTSGWTLSLNGKNSAISLGNTWNTTLHADNPFRTLENLDATLRIQNKQLRIEHSELLFGGTRIRTTGQTTFAKTTTSACPDIQAQIAQIANIIGTSSKETKPELEIDFNIDPAAPNKTSIHANIRNLRITHNDLTLNNTSLKLALNKNNLTAKNIIAKINNAGTLTGNAEINLHSKTWKTELHASGAHPDPIGALVGPALQKWIDRATFTNQAPDIHINLSGGPKQSIKMDGTLLAKNLTTTGGPLETLRVDMAYSNRLLSLTKINATLGSQQFDGTVQIDFAQKLAKFDIRKNELPLKTIARILAPTRKNPLEHLTINGPITSKAHGQIDYKTWTNHIIHGTLHAENISAKNIHAETFTSQIYCNGTQLNFTNTTIQLCNGTLNGSAEFDIHPSDNSAQYHIQASAAKLDIQQIPQKIQTQAKGILSGTLDLTADAKKGFWNTAQGHGHINIEEGHLAKIPFLGGFSHHIAGTKIFSITTLTANYELSDGKLQSETIQLGGTLLSAQAKGNYSPKTGLDFRLRAAPLRATREDKNWFHLHLWSADALKKTTAPIFELLEFDLKGTLKKPKWRMKVLPIEISKLWKIY